MSRVILEIEEVQHPLNGEEDHCWFFKTIPIVAFGLMEVTAEEPEHSETDHYIVAKLQNGVVFKLCEVSLGERLSDTLFRLDIASREQKKVKSADPSGCQEGSLSEALETIIDTVDGDLDDTAELPSIFDDDDEDFDLIPEDEDDSVEVIAGFREIVHPIPEPEDRIEEKDDDTLFNEIWGDSEKEAEDKT